MPSLPILRLRRDRAATHPSRVNTLASPPSRRPIYIYPGVIRLTAQRAMDLDNACPASVYGSPNVMPPAGQNDTCAICLDSFVSQRDIIRKLPCGHIFHSQCILSWISAADRCPLCNEAVVSRCFTISPCPDAVVAVKFNPNNQIAGLSDSTLSDTNRGTNANQAQVSKHSPNVERRYYSFVVHDQARYTLPSNSK